MTIKDPTYFPIDKGLYEVSLGLKPLGFNFGNPDFDQKIFHRYSNYHEYYQNKLVCINERPSKYVCDSDLSVNRLEGLIDFLKHQIIKDNPDFFKIENNTLYNLLTKQAIHLLDNDRKKILNELCLCVQEDVALVSRNDFSGITSDKLTYLHLCSPSHWAAEDKIGKSFFEIHTPIPGIEKLNSQSSRIIDTMIHKGPFVRFIWSFVTDNRLNHHPTPPIGIDSINWRGRSFNSYSEIPFQLRIERQVIYGLPEHNSSVFIIGVNFIPGDVVKANSLYREQLRSALLSMNEESKTYKGVDQCFEALLHYLS